MRDADLQRLLDRCQTDTTVITQHALDAKRRLQEWVGGFGTGSNGRGSGTSDPTPHRAQQPTGIEAVRELESSIMEATGHIHRLANKVRETIGVSTAEERSSKLTPECPYCSAIGRHEEAHYTIIVDGRKVKVCEWHHDNFEAYGVAPGPLTTRCHFELGKTFRSAQLLKIFAAEHPVEFAAHHTKATA